MDWRFAGKMGIIGLPLGLLSIMGWFPLFIEPYVWLGIAFWWVTTVIRKAPEAPFQHVMAASLIASFLFSDVQAIFFDTYVSNNPRIAEQVAQLEPGAPVRTSMIIAGLVRGLLFGALGGVAAMVALRFSGRRDAGKDARADDSEE